MTDGGGSNLPLIAAVVADAEQKCHRCQGGLYLSAEVPAVGMPGWQRITLCPVCDANDPASQDLIAFFAIHSVVDEQTNDTFTRLVYDWLTAKRPQGVSPEKFEEDIAAWQQGLYDA
ncbi:DUF6300 family protein [Micromonospora sp. NPDC047730]|uniref:DUF6300 family protein n=1 Tax=Micromonospora sp. NPDC047730 TaxID=3364253 RepID=UPI00371A7011